MEGSTTDSALAALDKEISEKYPILNFRVDPDHMIEGSQHVLHNLFPTWDFSKIMLKQFTDGLTNKLYKVVAEFDHDFGPVSHKTILVRVYGKKTQLLIDRERETRNLVCLAKAKVVPPLYGRFLNGVCYGYVDGIPFSVSDMKSKGELVAQRLAFFHSADIIGSRQPTFFATLRKWVSKIRASIPSEVDALKGGLEIDWLESVLLTDAKTPPHVCFCHNDLLSGNLIYQRGHVLPTCETEPDKVAFIDLEYSSFNYRAFDIANHFAEMMGYTVDIELYPTPEFRRQWLHAYLAESYKLAGRQEPVDEAELDQLFDEVHRWSIAPHLNWGIWALVQARFTGNTEFDYVDYSRKLLRVYKLRKAIVYPEAPATPLTSAVALSARAT